jgi:hypothetical protein
MKPVTMVGKNGGRLNRDNPGPWPGAGRHPEQLRAEALYELCEPLANDDGKVMTSNQMASWIMRNHPEAMVRLAAKRTLMEAAQHNKPVTVVISESEVIAEALRLSEIHVRPCDTAEDFKELFFGIYVRAGQNKGLEVDEAGSTEHEMVAERLIGPIL